MAGFLDSQNFLPLLTLLILIALVMSILDALSKTRIKKQLQPRVITVIKCENNDYEAKREFKKGDFVGKIEGKCPKCGSNLIIHAIYAEYPEEEKGKKKSKI